MSISELRERLADARAKETRLSGELEEIHARAGGRALSAGEQERWDRTSRAVEKVRQEIPAVTEELRDETRKLAGLPGHAEPGDGNVSATQFMQRVDPFDDAYGARDRARALLDDRRSAAHLSDQQRSHVDGLLKAPPSDSFDASYLAARTVITEDPAYRSAFQQMLVAGARGEQPMLTNEEITAMRRLSSFEQSHSRAMNEGSGAAGQFGIPVLIDPTIILTAQGTASLDELLSVARVEQITTKEWNGVTSAGATWSFDDEAEEVSDDSPTLAQPTVTTHMAKGFIPFSFELEGDYPAFADEMSRLLMEGYEELVTAAITTGSGTGEPFGIITALDANTNVEVKVTTSGSLAAVDVYKLWDALPNRFRRNASWMSSTNVENGVRQLGSGSVDSSANFSINLTQNSVDMLFGKRYIKNDWMSDLVSGTTAANLLVVGDFRNLLIAQRVGMRVEVVQHLFGTNRRPTGERGLLAWARIGSDSVNDSAFRILQNPAAS